MALKELKELDASILWSRKYTKQDFKSGFVYPLFIFGIVIFGLINYGVKYRLYYQYIKHGRRLEFHERLNIDLDDIESYPPSVFKEYQEK